MEPELEQAKKDTEGLAQDLDDVLVYALYPITGKRFLNWKYGKEDPPPEVKPRTLEEIKKEDLISNTQIEGLFIPPKTKEVEFLTGSPGESAGKLANIFKEKGFK